MTSFICAAFIGAVITALQHVKIDKIKAGRVFLAGFFLAVFLGDDVVNIIQHYFSFKISKGGVFFLVSFLGAEVLERLIILIRLTNTSWIKK